MSKLYRLVTFWPEFGRLPVRISNEMTTANIEVWRHFFQYLQEKARRPLTDWLTDWLTGWLTCSTQQCCPLWEANKFSVIQKISHIFLNPNVHYNSHKILLFVSILSQIISVTPFCPVSLRSILTLNPLTWKIWWAPNNASKWQIGFNSAFKGLISSSRLCLRGQVVSFCWISAPKPCMCFSSHPCHNILPRLIFLDML